ncbi:MAG: thioesterase family protein [Planctomycetota bacterium]|nr:thioesterase family protein [Planctomycetota bacterium]
MASEYRRTRRVEFSDTDTAGLVHFTALFRYMEETEHEFLRSLDLSVHPPADGGFRIGFPRIAARCDFLGPARFEDEVEVHLRVLRKGRTTITYQYVLSNRRGGGTVAQGEMSVICCRLGGDGRLERTELPAPYVAAIEESSAAPLAFGPGVTSPGRSGMDAD